MNLIPEGEYQARAVQHDDGGVMAEFGKSMSKETPYVEVMMEIIEGEHAGDRMPWTGYLKDTTIKRTVKALRTMGFKGEDLAAMLSQPLDRPVSITVKHEEYKGKVRARIEWINGSNAGLKGEALKQFADSMKHAIRAADEPDSADDVSF